MSIEIKKSKLALILVIAFTFLVVIISIGTAYILMTRNVGPTENKAASACTSSSQSGCNCHYSIGAQCGSVTCKDGYNDYSGNYTCYTDGSDACVSSSSACSAHGGVGTATTTTPATTVGGGLADCNGRTTGVLSFGSGATLRIINCNTSAVSISCSFQQFTCNSTAGDGNGSQCSSNPVNSGSKSYTVAGQSIQDVSVSCSPQCGSCQADASCSGGGITNQTVGIFHAASASCSTPVPTTVNQTTRVPQTTTTTISGSTTVTTTTSTTTSTTASTTTVTTTTTRAVLPNTGILEDTAPSILIGLAGIIAAVIAFRFIVIKKRIE